MGSVRLILVCAVPLALGLIACTTPGEFRRALGEIATDIERTGARFDAESATLQKQLAEIQARPPGAERDAALEALRRTLEHLDQLPAALSKQIAEHVEAAKSPTDQALPEWLLLIAAAALGGGGTAALPVLLARRGSTGEKPRETA